MKKNAVWLDKDPVLTVDHKWARKYTPIGERVSIQGSVEKLILSHPETQEFLPEKPVE